MADKRKLKKTSQGVYFIEIPYNMIRIAKLKEGDTLEFIPASALTPKKDDLILRKIP